MQSPRSDDFLVKNSIWQCWFSRNFARDRIKLHLVQSWHGDNTFAISRNVYVQEEKLLEPFLRVGASSARQLTAGINCKSCDNYCATRDITRQGVRTDCPRRIKKEFPRSPRIPLSPALLNDHSWNN